MTETHAEISMRHQPCVNIGLNICQNLSSWVIALQMYSILCSTSWQTHCAFGKKSSYVLVGKN